MKDPDGSCGSAIGAEQLTLYMVMLQTGDTSVLIKREGKYYG